MKQATILMPPSWGFYTMLCCFLALPILADQVDMQSGDRYLGKVVSMDRETLVVQNDVLGTLRLPRSKVATITLGTVTGQASSRAGTNAPAPIPSYPAVDSNGIAAKINANSNLVDRVQKQLLAGAGPEAQQKFNELLSGVLNGKLSIEDLRAQARSTAEQVRAMRKDMDESAGWAIDGYLAILDRFLGESPASAKAATNAPSQKPRTLDLLEEQ